MFLYKNIIITTDYDSLWTNCRRTLEYLGRFCPQRPKYGPEVLADGDSDAQTTICENLRGVFRPITRCYQIKIVVSSWIDEKGGSSWCLFGAS